MSLTLSLKPTHKPVKQYYAELGEQRQLSLFTEGNLSPAFASLLRHCAGQTGHTLAEQYTYRTGDKNIRFDGALLTPFKLIYGVWEAKDSDDKLEKEIEKKFKAGYPRDNILFQAPDYAILVQDGEQVFNAPITDPAKLVDVLSLFFQYQPPKYEQWEQAVSEFKDRVPQLAAGLLELIEKEYTRNVGFIRAFDNFYELCRRAINPNLSRQAVEEMLIQHMLTERIFRRVFNNPEFAQRNIIAREIESVIQALTSQHFSRDAFLRDLDRFYGAIELTAGTIRDYSEKQGFLNTVYEQFFQGFSIKTADTHGIVYTPQPIVDFMVRSVEDILQREFGRSMTDEGVHILDPFVGTGNFILRVLREIASKSKSRLPHKFAHELHCNEVMLLPYYIASMNIEHEFLELTGQYAPFDGICLVDTFELAEARQLPMFTEANTERVAHQKKQDIFVIIGNPPYNAWQVNENDNNKNRRYAVLDKRLNETYVKASSATLRNSLYDPYVKAIRWASDRIGQEGVVAFVTNNSFIDNIAFDGMRKHLGQEFDAVYVLDLGGNVRKNPKLSGTTHNVFGIQVGVSINFFVRRRTDSDKPRTAQIYYARVDEFWRKEQKYDFLAVAQIPNLTPQPPVIDTVDLTPQPPLQKTERGSLAAGQSSQTERGSLAAGQSSQTERGSLAAGQSSQTEGRDDDIVYGKRSAEKALWEGLKPLAREMRHEPTKAENELWQRLRNRQIQNAKFRRQHAIERFIVDFYCPEANLVIEVDGEIHQYTQVEDALRQQYLESQGLLVLRFPNKAVLNSIETVLDKIAAALARRLQRSGQPHPNPSISVINQPHPNPYPHHGEGLFPVGETPNAEGLSPAAQTPPLRFLERGQGGKVNTTPHQPLPTTQGGGLSQPHPNPSVSGINQPHPNPSPHHGEGLFPVGETPNAEELSPAAQTPPLRFLERGQGGEVNTMTNWQPITPNATHTWLTAGMQDDWADFLPMGTKEAKRGTGDAIFELFSNGVKTNRDSVIFAFDRQILLQRMSQFIENYNQEVDRYKRGKPTSNIDDFIRHDLLKWDGSLKERLQSLRYGSFDEKFARSSLYRPFSKRQLYFDWLFINRTYQFPRIFPTPETEQENRVICVSGIGSSKPFHTLITNQIPCLDILEKTQCFPFYIYNEDGSNRRENISDWALEQFRAHYQPEQTIFTPKSPLHTTGDPTPTPPHTTGRGYDSPSPFFGEGAGGEVRIITKWDIFYYIYALLHHPDYRTKYAANLRRELPRVPFVPSQIPTPNPSPLHGEGNLTPPLYEVERGQGGEDKMQRGQGGEVSGFFAFADAGRKLAELHINYEQQPEYRLQRMENADAPLDWRVEKMRWNRDKTAIIYNDFLTLGGIPAEAHAYKLGSRSALDWLIEEYRVTTDKRSGITNDPNRLDEPEYIVRLIGKVTHVSIETMKIIASLPPLV